MTKFKKILMIMKALQKQNKNQFTELENDEVNKKIDDQLRKSKERIMRLKALSVKLKSEPGLSDDKVSDVIAGNVKARGAKN